LSHVVFQGVLGEALYTAGALPHSVWSAAPVGPLAIPATLNNMFWDGLWGMLYGLLEPRLTFLLGRFGGGVAVGLASVLVFWFMVLPLKGATIGDLSPIEVAIDVGFDLVFGAGTAVLFYIGLHLNRRRLVC
jgi:hypothetical protein